MNKQIKEIIQKHWKDLKKKPNVIGIDGEFLPKIRKKKTYKKIKCVRIYISKKVPLDEFDFRPSLSERIKRVFHKNSHLHKKDLVPPFIEGIPTDLIEIGEIKARNNKSRIRPVIAGISGCHKDCTACTTSGFFEDTTGFPRILLAGLNEHCGGLEGKARIGDPWLQPSPYDGGKYPQDEYARLYRRVEIKFNEFKCPVRNFFHRVWKVVARKEDVFNKVDICFGKLTVNYKVKTYGIKDSFKGKRTPPLGEKVQKAGRTTGYTDWGKVKSLDWIGQVQYSRGTATFEDCILIEGKNFSAGGDSGSPVLDIQGNLIGVLFAGSETHTIICKIKNIEEIGKVRLKCIE